MSFSKVSLSCALVLFVCSQAAARPARPAPALPPPSGTVINVSTEAQLQAAMGAIGSNTTIVLAPGTYRLTRSLYFKGPFTNVGIRGATGNPGDVTLVGTGMTNAAYGSVPYGIWTGDGIDGITIANLTSRDFYYHPIIFNAGTQRPHVFNLHLIDAGQQFLKSNPDAAGVGASDGVVEYSVFEFTTTARDDYPKAIDVQGGADWVIRHNLFHNLQAPFGLIGPAVLVWRGSSNTITEGNTFLNCGRGIMYGAEDAPAFAHSGGVIRNNFFYRSSTQPGDVGIQVADSPNTQVVNNTVVLSGTYSAAIEYRFTGASGISIVNNLVDGMIWQRDGATASLASNIINATPSMFVNPSAGDLHLQPTAIAAIDQGVAVASVANDWDGQLRPAGRGFDIGADEYAASTAAYSVTGRVTAAATGNPIPGVMVTLVGSRSGAVTVDSSGAFAFTALPAGGDYTVAPSLVGYTFLPEQAFYNALAGDVADVNFFGTPMVLPSRPPIVTMTVTSQTIMVGERLTLNANASDPDGGISSVAFYVNQKPIVTDSAPPYSATWKAAKSGSYTFRAVASDLAGATTSSEAIVVSVVPKPRR